MRTLKRHAVRGKHIQIRMQRDGVQQFGTLSHTVLSCVLQRGPCPSLGTSSQCSAVSWGQQGSLCTS
eukprot:118327-Pyramimonas_sp.AAC.1